jgi:hypothetical protein
MVLGLVTLPRLEVARRPVGARVPKRRHVLLAALYLHCRVTGRSSLVVRRSQPRLDVINMDDISRCVSDYRDRTVLSAQDGADRASVYCVAFTGCLVSRTVLSAQDGAVAAVGTRVDEAALVLCVPVQPAPATVVAHLALGHKIQTRLSQGSARDRRGIRSGRRASGDRIRRGLACPYTHTLPH